MGVYVAPGAMLDLRGDGITVGALTGSGSVVNTYSNNGFPGLNTLTVGYNNVSSTFSGSILGTDLGGSYNNTSPNCGVTVFVKTGSGVFTLFGPSNYTGGTTVSGGTLVAAADSRRSARTPGRSP